MISLVIAAWAFAFGVVDAPPPAQVQPNPTGTWKGTFGSGGRPRAITIKLKLELNRVTGAIVGRNGREMPIKDVQYQDGAISFEVSREWNGEKSITRYSGRVNGDALQGKTESQRGGQVFSRDWKARRARE